jgi:magnesium-transporting ATPase (P-type)
MAKFYPKFFCDLVRDSCSFEEATHILVLREERHYEEVRVLDNGGPDADLDYRVIEYRKERFVYNLITQTFVFQSAKLKDLLPSQLSSLLAKGGLSELEAHQKMCVNGPNKIIIDDVPIFTMLADKITQIFYLFQIASVIIWLIEGYTTYAWLILIMSSASIIWEIYSAKVNEKQLRSLTEMESDFHVIRNGEVRKIPAEFLVVGDTVVLEPNTLVPNTKLPCDLVLMQGECLMDESSLTGETVPVLKLPLQVPEKSFEVPLDMERNRTNILYGGSTILQLKPKVPASQTLAQQFYPPSRDPSLEILLDTGESYDVKKSSNLAQRPSFHLESRPSNDASVLGIVLSTGFSTSKGDLFKSILFPTEVELRLNKDSMSFLMILGAIAFLAFLNKMINGYFFSLF